MAGEEASLGLANSGKPLVDGGNQLLDESLAPRAVVGRVGEDMVPQPAVGIEDDPDHLDAGDVRGVAPLTHEGEGVPAAEAGDFVDDGVAPIASLLVRH